MNEKYLINVSGDWLMEDKVNVSKHLHEAGVFDLDYAKAKCDRKGRKFHKLSVLRKRIERDFTIVQCRLKEIDAFLAEERFVVSDIPNDDVEPKRVA